jgi:uncharacterized protein YjbI with pentapeptide repeats
MQPLASGAAAQDGRVRYTQDQIDQFVAAHERFQRRQPKGRRAVLPFLLAQGVDFSRRMLVEADFTGADLRQACLFMADLERAALFCADLRGADVRGANLYRADMRGCSLRDANLNGAKLDDADMRDAVLARMEHGRFTVISRSDAVPEGGGMRFRSISPTAR